MNIMRFFRPSVAIDVSSMSSFGKSINWNKVIEVYHKYGVILYDGSYSNAPTPLSKFWFGKVSFINIKSLSEEEKEKLYKLFL